ncbi:hypothetical protein C0992_010530 [Termitomyces sp. T32_za158]|nr:hypothetical protein C0992_010530 [Termitomyces sp. T32_za158]
MVITRCTDAKNEDFVDENGIRTVIEYTINDEGKKVKVRATDQVITRRIKRTLQKSIVEHAVAERQKWTKFGAEKGNKAGPDRATTTVGENVSEAGGEDDTHEPAAPAASSGGKYVPPSMRGPGGARTAGVGGTREELPTLRVTNISEDTHEQDLRDLFGRFGRVTRVFIGRDRETGAGKGFAFVSFDERASAQRAMDKVHGMGYDNLILSVQWSRESSQASK